VTARGAWFVARADLAAMLRQRETLLWVFVMPVVFFYFIGTITGGAVAPGMPADRPDPLRLDAPADAGVLLDEIARRLEGQHFRVERAVLAGAAPEAPGSAVEGAARSGTPPRRRLVVEPPASGRPFTEAILAGERQALRFETPAEGPAAAFERLRVQRALYGVVADLAVLVDEGRPVDAAGFRALAAAPRPVALEVSAAGRRARVPRGYEQTIPGTTVMFTMLVLLTGGAIQLVIERRRGLLRRLASTPLSRGAVVAGKWAGKLALGLVQLAFAMLAGTVLFDMRWGPALPMVALLLAAWAAFNASLGLLLGGLARSEGQMVGIGVLSSMLLGALGGCWWPIEIAPRWMQSLALALPTGWTMDAMHRLVSFGDPAPAALPHLAALAVGTIVVGLAAARTFRYQE
jgi:ABC-type multidrug transport system permease subunit